MTSQKRYRHQDNSSNSLRTRDIPPRFKRQKSTSSTPLATRSASPPSSQSTSYSSSDNMTKVSLAQSSSESSNNTGSFNNASPRGLTYTVLPPHDKMANIPMAQPVFSYQSSGWPMGVLPTQPLMVNPVMIPQTLGQAPIIYNNENCAPSPSFYMAPQSNQMSPWSNSGHTTSPYHSSCSSPALSTASPKPEEVRGCVPTEHAGQPDVNYMDPADLRTIEMLRELERVADKESQEEQDGGGDRKSHVSHHLRMLMCAVDRYTEGIEDDLSTNNTRNDDGLSPHNSNKSSPSVSPTPSASMQQFKQSSDSGRDTHQQSWNAQMQQNHSQQPWQGGRRQENATSWIRSRPVLGLGSTSGQEPTLLNPRSQPEYVTSASQLMPNPVPQTPWTQPRCMPQQLQRAQGPDWNLWSSPSFDFFGMLGYAEDPNGCGSPGQSFELFQEACFPTDKKERKPLYKRY